MGKDSVTRPTRPARRPRRSRRSREIAAQEREHGAVHPGIHRNRGATHEWLHLAAQSATASSYIASIWVLYFAVACLRFTFSVGVSSSPISKSFGRMWNFLIVS